MRPERRCRGQSVAEYLLLFGVVAAAVMAMLVYAKRGVQAGLKASADQMTPFTVVGATPEQVQVAGMRQETGDTRDPGEPVVVGMAVARDSTTVTTQGSNINTQAAWGGGQTVTHNANLTQTVGTSSSKVVAEIK